jgi:hypothetical protein
MSNSDADFHATAPETLIAAMQELSRSIQSADGIANAAIAEAALQMDAMVREIASLRHVAGVMQAACQEAADCMSQLQSPHGFGPALESAIFRTTAAVTLAKRLNLKAGKS